MDMSKLPRLSNTDQPATNAADPQPSSPHDLDYYSPTINTTAEAWISIAIGVIVLLMQRTVVAYLLGRETPTVSDPNRGSITYAESFFFIHDLGLFVFGIALVLDGLLLFFNRPWATLIGLTITIIAALLNLYTVIRLYTPQGLQLFAAIAFILAVYTAIYQWKLLRITRDHRPAPMT
jgi:hypothetical protein